MTANTTRVNEWFVPKFGPEPFRMIIGLLYLPYTGMCISFTVFGSLLVSDLHWDRLAAIATIYFLGLGVSAHAADALGSKNIKPWGTHFTRFQLRALIVAPLAGSYSIGLYYILFYTPMLVIIAILEGFLLFAYNFEWFSGKFHNDLWFSVAWGALPLLAGYIIQSDLMSITALAAAGVAALASYGEIRFSRPYKVLTRQNMDNSTAKILERRLKVLSISTISTAISLLIFRVIFH